jgi:hypothetical protein
VVLAAALILSGCGETPVQTAGKTPDASPSQLTTAPGDSTASASVAPAGRLLVEQKGTRTQDVWYLRIEGAKGALVSEQAFPAGSISLDKSLPPGDYRVVGWRRACTGACPSVGEKGLGPLKDVCGTTFHLSIGKTVLAKVAINPDGSCAFSKPA